MNKQADFGETRFEFIETVSHPQSKDVFVICQSDFDKRFACTLSDWEKHAVSNLAIENDAQVTTHSSKQDKIDLFLSLFRGREDVYAKRYYNLKSGKSGYVPACGNEWARGLCDKKATACKDCFNRNFLPLNEEIIARHLRGNDPNCRDVAGIYPLLDDETTYLLAIDFDDEGWEKDVSAFAPPAVNPAFPFILNAPAPGTALTHGSFLMCLYPHPTPGNLAVDC